ncbi:MAG TPA: hypothetical protein VF070_26165 [Streptosporangiaceae bacterium]
MSTRDRRKSDDEVHAHEEVRQTLVPAPRARPSDEMFLASATDQAQYQIGSNGVGRPVTDQRTTSANEATVRGTAAAVRWTTSNQAAFQIELPRSRPRQSRPPSEAISREKLLGYAGEAERRILELAARWFEPGARIAVFIIYFWFGFLKVIGLSPATPLASALTRHTIGMQYFNISFRALAFYECGIAVLFLIPALTWLSVALLVIHMGIVTSPLVIVANVAWTHPLVPTLEGQYIIKDLAIIALAFGILAHRYRYHQQVAPQPSRLAAAAAAATRPSVGAAQTVSHSGITGNTTSVLV